MKNFIQINDLRSENSAYILLLSAIILFAYIIPVTTLQTPSGTDAYTHIFYTEVMLESDSLAEFYGKCFERGYLGFDYPR